MSLKTVFMQEPDIEIVGEASNIIDILLEVGNSHAEVVAIDVPLSGKDSGLCSHLLAEYPEVKVFALSEEGNRIVMYETAMVRKQASETSVEKLVDLIRHSVRGEDNGWYDTYRLQ
jgi:DNA-binding NarL/FixJ family response regulator